MKKVNLIMCAVGLIGMIVMAILSITESTGTVGSLVSVIPVCILFASLFISGYVSLNKKEN